MAHSIFKSASGSTAKQLRLVAMALFLWALLSTLGIYYRVKQAARNERLVQHTVKVQGYFQPLNRIAQAQLVEQQAAQNQTAQNQTPSALPTSSQQTIAASIQNIDQILEETEPQRSSIVALRAESAQLIETWTQLKATFATAFDDRNLDETSLDSALENALDSASNRLTASENFLALTQQVLESAEAHAQKHNQQTQQLLGVVFIGYLGAIAYLLRITQQLQQTLKATARTMAAASNELSVAIDQQSQTVFDQSTAIDTVKATLQQLENSARQTTEQANTAMVSATTAIQRNQTIGRPLQSTLERTLTSSTTADALAQRLSMLKEQTDSINALSALFSDFSHRLGMLILSPAMAEITAETHSPELVETSHEVRSLAQQSQNISQEINHVVHELQATLNDATTLSQTNITTTQSGLESARSIVQAFEQMEEADDKIVATTQQFSLLLEQQFDAVSQVLEALTTVDQNSQGVVSSFTQAQVATEELKQTLSLLQQIT
ncbi:MAG: hypothetical protein AB8B99_02230 [Phormidesmis sp.]